MFSSENSRMHFFVKINGVYFLRIISSEFEMIMDRSSTFEQYYIKRGGKFYFQDSNNDTMRTGFEIWENKIQVIDSMLKESFSWCTESEYNDIQKKIHEITPEKLVFRTESDDIQGCYEYMGGYWKFRISNCKVTALFGSKKPRAFTPDGEKVYVYKGTEHNEELHAGPYIVPVGISFDDEDEAFNRKLLGVDDSVLQRVVEYKKYCEMEFRKYVQS